MGGDETRRRTLFLPILVPIASLILMAFAVSPYNPNDVGSYGDAWPDIAAIWLTAAIMLTAFWALSIKAGPAAFESRLPPVVILAVSATAALLGALALVLSGRVTGFPSEYQHLMYWFSVTVGLLLLGLAILLKKSLTGRLLGSFAYVASVALGVASVGAAIVLSFLLLVAFSGGGIT